MLLIDDPVGIDHYTSNVCDTSMLSNNNRTPFSAPHFTPFEGGNNIYPKFHKLMMTSFVQYVFGAVDKISIVMPPPYALSARFWFTVPDREIGK